MRGPNPRAACHEFWLASMPDKMQIEDFEVMLVISLLHGGMPWVRTERDFSVLEARRSYS